MQTQETSVLTPNDSRAVRTRVLARFANMEIGESISKREIGEAADPRTIGDRSAALKAEVDAFSEVQWARRKLEREGHYLITQWGTGLKRIDYSEFARVAPVKRRRKMQNSARRGAEEANSLLRNYGGVLSDEQRTLVISQVALCNVVALVAGDDAHKALEGSVSSRPRISSLPVKHALKGLIPLASDEDDSSD